MRLVTLEEAAEMLAVSPSSLKRWKAEGTLPGALAITVGSSIRFVESDLVSWIGEQGSAERQAWLADHGDEDVAVG